MLSLIHIFGEIRDAFKYAGGRDLSGYEDGTENPTGDAAISAAIVGSGSQALAGRCV